MLCMPYKHLSWKQFQTEHALKARERRDQQHRHSYWQHTLRLFRRRRRQVSRGLPHPPGPDGLRDLPARPRRASGGRVLPLIRGGYSA